MKKIAYMIVALAMVAAPMAFADTTWTGVNGINIKDAGNWNSGLPTGGSIGTVTDADVELLNDNGLGMSGGYDVVFAGGSTFTNNSAGKSNFILNGAKFTFNDTSSLATVRAGGHALDLRYNGTLGGEFHWNSTGTFDNINRILLNGTDALMTQSTGLVIGSANLEIYSATARYVLSGGALVMDGILDSAFNGKIDFLTTGTGGTLSIGTGQTSVLEGYITDGRIILDGAQATLADFSIMDNGTITTLSVIPEPATLGMVVAFGGSLLFIRRKLMM